MPGSAFRSHLMQQFVTAARNQNRNSAHHIRLSTSSQSSREYQLHSRNGEVQDASSLRSNSISSTSRNSSPNRLFPTRLDIENKRSLSPVNRSFLRSFVTPTRIEEEIESQGEKDDDDENDYDYDDAESNSNSFQTTLSTRRTISNFLSLDIISMQQQQQIRDAIGRAIECGMEAPNHHRTEPTTYYRIMPNSSSWEKLMDITYNVTLLKNKSMSNKTAEEAKINAESKRDKWKGTISGYVVVCVNGQPNQCIHIDQDNIDESEDQRIKALYGALPFRPPETEKQLEDYASACASIQNMLLALHSEGIGAKWATGPVVRCKALRDLVECDNDDLIAGLIMVGIAKRTPRKWNKRRNFIGDVLRDL
mmetsp:Transcript_9124/g.11503  ORF Transcript_9124/g.11503 Transcript_9124/m.11503 type:complete len:365 (+) Transcript_9124:272-1366(+)